MERKTNLPRPADIMVLSKLVALKQIEQTRDVLVQGPAMSPCSQSL